MAGLATYTLIGMDPRLFRSLEWRCIGPHRGGRVVAVAGHPTETGTFYFGACAGGVWKTTNAGSHWWNISDGFFNTAAVGALAVSDSDPNVIYAGTGEACIRSNVSHGDGVYRSDDGGRTWRNVGLAPTRHISGLAIHPTNPDVVYVAALGRAWGTNPERGVYRSRDGGQSWDLVLHKSERAGAAALSMDIKNPRVLYAAIWQGRRYPHAAHSGGEDSGLYRSLDGGDTWTEVSRNKGFPKRARWGAWESLPRQRNLAACGRWSKKPSRVACTARTTTARRGTNSTTTPTCGGGPGTTCTSLPTPATPTWSGS